jgi:hypothetical protein
VGEIAIVKRPASGNRADDFRWNRESVENILREVLAPAEFKELMEAAIESSQDAEK